MGRLVVVSNRVPSSKERVQPAGGLTVGLKDAIKGEPSLWFGWSGNAQGKDDEPRPVIEEQGGTTYATIDLTPAQHKGFYQGFSNGILWPVCHYRLALMSYSREELQTYLEVNALFARVLKPLLKPDDVIWVQDYQLFTLGEALRELGVRNRIGFFLHIPFPPPGLFGALPGAEQLLRAIGRYDVIGMQTEEDARNINASFEPLGIAVRAGVFPIGIDPQSFLRDAISGGRSAQVKRFDQAVGDRPLIIGVDRLDYSKGLPERFHGFDRLLRRFPQHRGKVSFLQVAPVSRGEVQQYRRLRRELDELAGRINGDWAEMDWTPLRYITRAVPRKVLASVHRRANIGLVTPLRDGMNLVAKEYVAAQDPEDPGVLVLSRFAGAAPELPDALLVNPYDPDEIAEALDQALGMSLSERKRRWSRMHEAVTSTTAATWARDFLQVLRGAPEAA
ncbi:alpha,alpha-trehalose-phosphate synthase (UDP-forming) [Rhizosaccharibacter radicis]|uniref:Trehalose-6-phosphate synthase n=1 Tax=Rhizosaccharibacter radicis TaxID=2782605 RepID=A0ABT1VZC1_9PROT|nr:trehalose-6-phosphate synthase [Acetobacteraceae bacterium KSS12]